MSLEEDFHRIYFKVAFHSLLTLLTISFLLNASLSFKQKMISTEKNLIKPQPSIVNAAHRISDGAVLTTTVIAPKPTSNHIRGNSDYSSSSPSSLTASVYQFKSPPLSSKRHSRFLRHARRTVFNVYRRLFSIVFLLNVVGVGILLGRYRASVSSAALLADLATAAAANIMVALWIRQDYVINGLFKSVLLFREREAN
jgi:hypothetical protein